MVEDPYLMGKGVLRNKLGIDDYDELRKAEKDIIFTKLIGLEDLSVDVYDYDSIRDVHKYLFDDIFDWAGEYRTVSLFKKELIIPGAGIQYAESKEIPSKVKIEIEQLKREEFDSSNKEDYVQKLVKHSAKLWRIHPFRDGNTRTMLAYMKLLSKENGVNLDLGSIANQLTRIEDKETLKVLRWSIRDKFVLASLDEKDYPETEPLVKLISKAVTMKEKGKEIETER